MVTHIVKLPDNIREFFRKQGKIGAAKRHANMSPKRRKEVAKMAAATRWAKTKSKSATKKTTRRGTSK